MTTRAKFRSARRAASAEMWDLLVSLVPTGDERLIAFLDHIDRNHQFRKPASDYYGGIHGPSTFNVASGHVRYADVKFRLKRAGEPR